MTRVKICGLKRVEDVAYVNESLPEYAGFVFAGSKRKVTDEQAEALRRMLDERIVPVGVFVNEPVEHILNLVGKKVIRVVQLHGDEDESYIQRLRAGLESKQGTSGYKENNKISRADPDNEGPGEKNDDIESVKIIKAVRVQNQEQILEAEKLSCDYLLLDTWQKDAYGGCGKQFDKSLIPEVKTIFSGRRTCGRQHPGKYRDLSSICGGCKQRCGDGRKKRSEKNTGIHRKG